MKKIRLAINGFGRIGRHAFKVALAHRGVEVVAINDLTDTKTLAHLLKYDTAYAGMTATIAADQKHLIINKKKIPSFAEKDPSLLPWKKLQVDVVIESTGRFTDTAGAGLHLKAGARRVIISAPGKGDDIHTYVRGINDRLYAKEEIIDNASCTTNSAAPVMAVLEAVFGVDKAMLTTIHSYTADQNLQDGPHRDLRRARAAAANIVPTSTGAAIAVTRVIPSLKNKFDGISFRVPTLTVSVTDLTVVLKKKTTKEAINDALTNAAKGAMKGILAVTNEPLVSSDFIGDAHSATVDLACTNVVGGTLVKVVVWYDNEWGYANRLVELADLVGRK